MTAEQLKNSILQEAISGRLVPQDPNDEPAINLLNKLRQRKEELDRLKQIPHKKPIVPLSPDSEFPFEIPQNWAWCLLAEVSLIQEGAGILKNQYRKEGVQLLTVTNIKEGAIDMGNHIICVDHEEYLNKYQQLTLKKGDIVTACSGGSWGKSAIFEESGVYMLNTSTLRLRFWDDLADNKYLYYLTKSFFFKSQLKEQLVGLQPNFGYAHYSKIKVPLPPLAEQKRIVAKLEELLPIVEQYGKAQKELDELNTALPARLRQSILQEAISGRLVPQDPNDEPASVLLQRIREEKAQLVKEKKLKKEKPSAPITEDEIPFEIPNSWEWCRLGDVVYNRGQKTPEVEFSYIDIGSIDNKHQKLSEKDNIIQPNDAPSRARKIVGFGDIVYSTVRPYLHNIAIIDRTFLHEPIASTGFAVFTCFSGLLNSFLFYYLLSPAFDAYANDGDNAKGIAYPAITDKKLYNAPVPLPPLAEQQRIVAKIEELFAEIDKLTK